MMAAATSATLLFFPPARLRPVGVESESFAAVLAGALFSFPPENQQIILTFHISMIILIEAKIFFKILELKKLNFVIFNLLPLRIFYEFYNVNLLVYKF